MRLLLWQTLMVFVSRFLCKVLPPGRFPRFALVVLDFREPMRWHVLPPLSRNATMGNTAMAILIVMKSGTKNLIISGLEIGWVHCPVGNLTYMGLSSKQPTRPSKRNLPMLWLACLVCGGRICSIFDHI